MLTIASDKAEGPKGFLSNLLKLDTNAKDDTFALLLKSFSFGKSEKNAVLKDFDKLNILNSLEKIDAKQNSTKTPLLQLFDLGKEELSDKDNLNPEVLKALPTKNLGQNIKQLIGEAKEYLKEQIALKADVKELPKTLGGLIKLAQKSGIEVKAIKFDTNTQAPLDEKFNKTALLDEQVKTTQTNKELPAKFAQTLPHTTSELVKPVINHKNEKDNSRPLDILLKKDTQEAHADEAEIKPAKSTSLSPSLSALLHTDKEKLSQDKEQFTKVETEKSSEKSSSILNTKTDQLSQKFSEAKQLIQHTAQSMREAVENYKPPFTRIKMQLNPQKFGEMDVTLVQRGNNVHININASTSALTLMMQNAHELKTALSTQGLGDASMNFSSHQQQHGEQKRQEHAGLSYEEYQDYEDEFSEVATALEVVVPRYI